MRKIQYFCDRCKKEITGEPLVLVFERVDRENEYVATDSICPYPEAHLCDDCMQNIVKWALINYEAPKQVPEELTEDILDILDDLSNEVPEVPIEVQNGGGVETLDTEDEGSIAEQDDEQDPDEPDGMKGRKMSKSEFVKEMGRCQIEGELEDAIYDLYCVKGLRPAEVAEELGINQKKVSNVAYKKGWKRGQA